MSRMIRRDGGEAPNLRIQVPVGQSGTLGPAITTFNKLGATNAGQKAGYEIWEGSVTVEDWTLGPISVSIVDGNGDEIDVLMVD